MINKNEFWKNYKSSSTYEITDLPNEVQECIKVANSTSEKAYAPYVKYHVGAVIRTTIGSVVSGCNSQTCNLDPICAEASAISAWVNECCKIDASGNISREEINYITVVGKPFGEDLREDVFVTPCGRCRQRIYEFCSNDTIIVCSNETVTKVKIFKLSDMLPDAFAPNNL